MPPAETKEQPTINLNPNQETVIIFDWDDTLLASSFLSGKGYRLDSTIEKTTEIENQLRDLEQSVITVLNLALSYGRVHIITNAEMGWVQLSAQKFIPGVVPLLSKVKVISARSTYENMYPESPLKWKISAFQDKLAKSFSEMKTEKNIISFGDSHVEREAVRHVTRGLPNTRTKSVKFAERPSMEQLRRQIELVTNCFQYIYHHEGDLDLQLTVTVNNENNSNNIANNPQTSNTSGGNTSGGSASSGTNPNNANTTLEMFSHPATNTPPTPATDPSATSPIPMQIDTQSNTVQSLVTVNKEELVLA